MNIWLILWIWVSLNLLAFALKISFDKCPRCKDELDNKDSLAILFISLFAIIPFTIFIKIKHIIKID